MKAKQNELLCDGFERKLGFSQNQLGLWLRLGRVLRERDHNDTGLEKILDFLM